MEEVPSTVKSEGRGVPCPYRCTGADRDLEKLDRVSEPQFSHLQHGHKSSTYLRGLRKVGMSGITCAEVSRRPLARGKRPPTWSFKEDSLCSAEWMTVCGD